MSQSNPAPVDSVWQKGLQRFYVHVDLGETVTGNLYEAGALVEAGCDMSPSTLAAEWERIR